MELARVTFKGGLRDKVFITLLAVSFVCFIFLVPSASSLSMRQVKEVAVSLSLSVISFVSLVLTIFLGVNLVYGDIERRFAHSVVSLPISRERYIIEKFLGLCAIVGCGMVILSVFSVAGIAIASGLSPSSLPMPWQNFIAAIFFDFITLVIVAAISVFFSAFSTNLFLPLFATIGVYLIGNVTQAVMDYLQGSSGKNLPAASVYLSKIAYYVFPNLSAFDFKFNAIYNIPIASTSMAATFAYGILYTIIVLGLSVLVFRKKELL